jgi:restriction endonuclease
VAHKLCVRGADDQDHIILAAMTDDGVRLDPKTAMRLFELPSRRKDEIALPSEAMKQTVESERKTILDAMAARQSAWFDQEMDKLDNWAEDRRAGLKAVINRESDRMSGRRPIEFLQAANPIVIIDEPQSVDATEKSQRAIGNLNPMVTLRYSATHRNPYNLLYKLDPIKAYDLRLVKRIEVASVRLDENFNEGYVKLISTDNSNGIRARIEIHKEGRSGPRATKLDLACR